MAAMTSPESSSSWSAALQGGAYAAEAEEQDAQYYQGGHHDAHRHDGQCSAVGVVLGELVGLLLLGEGLEVGVVGCHDSLVGRLGGVGLVRGGVAHVDALLVLGFPGGVEFAVVDLGRGGVAGDGQEQSKDKSRDSFTHIYIGMARRGWLGSLSAGLYLV